MEFEKQMYEVAEKWDESYFSQSDKKRVEFIMNLFPEDAKSILDVGCGNGILVNYIKDKSGSRFSRICGTDRSQTSLNLVRTEKMQADIDNLPFKNGEFEIVTCLEVIEHLPLLIFEKALKEIERIASKYVIISVPFNENLDYSKVTCVKCRTEFNPFYHMHSFNEEKLKTLFKDTSLSLVSFHKVERSSRPYFPFLKKKISNFINPNVFPPNCICPMCGYNEFEKLKVSKDKVENSKVEKVSGLSKYWPHYSEAKWIAGVFIKKG